MKRACASPSIDIFSTENCTLGSVPTPSGGTLGYWISRFSSNIAIEAESFDIAKRDHNVTGHTTFDRWFRARKITISMLCLIYLWEVYEQLLNNALLHITGCLNDQFFNTVSYPSLHPSLRVKRSNISSQSVSWAPSRSPVWLDQEFVWGGSLEQPGFNP